MAELILESPDIKESFETADIPTYGPAPTPGQSDGAASAFGQSNLA